MRFYRAAACLTAPISADTVTSRKTCCLKFLFTEQGAVDLIAVDGYYVLVSMILKVDRSLLTGGAKPPLSPLK